MESKSAVPALLVMIASNTALAAGPEMHTHVHRVAGPSPVNGGFNSIAAGCKLPAHLTEYGATYSGATNPSFTNSVRVVPVFWGSGVNSTTRSNIATSIDVMRFSNLDNWVKKQYRMPGFTRDPPITITPSNTRTTISPSDILSELNYQYYHGVLPGVEYSFLYVVYFPPTVTLTDGSGGQQCTSFCGYNSQGPASLGGTIFFVAEPDLTAISCIFNCRGNTTTAYDATTARAAVAWPLMGDFNGDGLADLALTGGGGWWTLPIAFSTGTQLRLSGRWPVALNAKST